MQYAVNGIYGNQGEVCNAGSRLIVDAKIHDEFVAKFLDKAKKSFTPGDPLDPSTTMGPLVTKEQQKRVLSYIDIGKKEGAKLALGGVDAQGPGQGLLRRADPLHRRQERHAHRQGGDLRPGRPASSPTRSSTTRSPWPTISLLVLLLQ